MKVYTTLLLLTAAMTLTTATPNAEEECGALGVMQVDPKDVPEGVTLADVRKCADHPEGRDISALEEGDGAPWGEEE
ncbi:hypothetical protein PHISCL_02989 [Aspergillus sclerotialis]|uniref:Secreted protein n=1 Tax=Aspergillus sclerotialis TaxID=2070753 RepID=A0A3A2ZZ69_9EURO|nr:hypothetical protein PHISCL_02989 [Aspergillus sclerotialis]